MLPRVRLARRKQESSGRGIGIMAGAAAPIVIGIVMAGATVHATAGRVRNRAAPRETAPAPVANEIRSNDRRGHSNKLSSSRIKTALKAG